MNRSLFFVALSGLLATLCGDDVLTWRVAKGTTLVRTFECTGVLELQSRTIKVDGAEQDGGPTVELSIGKDFDYEFSDRIDGVEDGRPTKLVRSFTKLSGSRTQTLKLPEKDAREDKSELTTELEGKHVLFVRDDDAWTAKWDADEKGDESLLKGLRAEVDLRAFLPGKQVASGDSWDLDASAFTELLRPAGQLSATEKGGDAATQNRHDRMLDDNLEGKATATFRGMREEEGVKVAVIAMSAELSTHAGEELDDGKAGPSKSSIELSYKLEGEILWDGAGGFARAASLTGSLEVVQTQQGKAKAPEGEHEIEQVLTFSGKASYKATNELKP